MIPNSDLENPEVPLSLVFLSMTLRRILMTGSPLYICSLDAEKCFDSIWRDALLYKHWEKLPLHHWLLMYRWSLGQVPIDNIINIEILGMILSSDAKCINQVDSRILKCRKSYFSLNNAGMTYPDLPVDLKLHLWHTMCRPILTFELETVYLNRAMYMVSSNRFRVQLSKLFLV